MEDGSVVELGALLAAAVPLLGSLGEADEVGDGLGRVLLEELADDGAFRGLEGGIGAGLGWHFSVLLTGFGNRYVGVDLFQRCALGFFRR